MADYIDRQYDEYRVGAITMSDRTEYINRQAAIDLMLKTPYLNTGGSGYTSKELHLFLAQEIRELPSADVQPVRHGKWIEENGLIYCSLCGDPWATEISTMIYSFNYCPNCGARQDGN